MRAVVSLWSICLLPIPIPAFAEKVIENCLNLSVCESNVIVNHGGLVIEYHMKLRADIIGCQVANLRNKGAMLM